MLGIGNSLPISKLYNHLCMITKHYIHVSRCMNKRPLYEALWIKIKNEKDIEQRIAIDKNNMTKFNEKWQELQSI